MRMVDLQGQYRRLKPDIDAAIARVLEATDFINGVDVKAFATELAAYNGSAHAIPCANGTDALQIALMALGLKAGDEVIVPAFTYVASAEVIGLLGLVPVMVDVDWATFNMTAEVLEGALSPRTKAIIPVHLFGQSCDMAPILDFARLHNLAVVEDNAQSIGAFYTFPDGRRVHTGAMGDVGCTSFFPSKNLGCYGDGGAMFANDDTLAERLATVANHGQEVKYYHKVLGCNSRLDTLQAAILRVKLRHLDEFCQARYAAAQRYTQHLKGIRGIEPPVESPFSTHVYHQYTLKVLNGRRDALKAYLETQGIPAMIYYPLPLQAQEAFKPITRAVGSLEVAQRLADSVLSLPIDTEIKPEEQDRVVEAIKGFFA
jgi:hypothetical protein